MARAGTASLDIVTDKTQLGRSISGSLGSQGGLFKSFGAKFAGIFAGGFAAMKGVEFFKGAIEEAREAAKVTKLTNAVIASTKGAANIGAEGVSNLAERLSNLAGIDDELIQSGENVLLTFTNIKNVAGAGNNIFDRATESALNMSSALGTDLQGSVIQVGKALNDPIKGVTSLARAGVQFTAQQKDQIKTLVQSGKTLEAQKIILGELNTQFGGAAAAAADPMQKLGVIWGNLKEQVGTALLPVLNAVATWLGKSLPGAIETAKKVLGPFVAGVKQVFAILFERDFIGGPFAEDSPFIDSVFNLRDTVVPIIQNVITWLKENWKTALAVAGAAFLLFTGPVTFVVAAIALLYIKFQGVRDFIGAAVAFIGEKFQAFLGFAQTVFPQIQEAIGHFVSIAMAAWRLFGDDIMTYVGGVFTIVKSIVTGALNVISGVIRFVLAIINGDWGKAWDALKDIVRAVFDTIKGVIRGALGVVQGVFGGAFDAIKRIVSTSIAKVIDILKGLPGSALKALGNLKDLLYDAGAQMMQGFINGIKSMAKTVANAAKSTVTGAVDGVKGLLRIGSPSKLFHQFGAWTAEGYAAGFISSMADTRGSILSAFRAAAVAGPQAAIGELGNGPVVDGEFRASRLGGAALAAAVERGNVVTPEGMVALVDALHRLADAGLSGTINLDGRKFGEIVSQTLGERQAAYA